jgi:hypothetical protein
MLEPSVTWEGDSSGGGSVGRAVKAGEVDLLKDALFMVDDRQVQWLTQRVGATVGVLLFSHG